MFFFYQVAFQQTKNTALGRCLNLTVHRTYRETPAQRMHSTKARKSEPTAVRGVVILTSVNIGIPTTICRHANIALAELSAVVTGRTCFCAVIFGYLPKKYKKEDKQALEL